MLFMPNSDPTICSLSRNPCSSEQDIFNCAPLGWGLEPDMALCCCGPSTHPLPASTCCQHSEMLYCSLQLCRVVTLTSLVIFLWPLSLKKCLMSAGREMFCFSHPSESTLGTEFRNIQISPSGINSHSHIFSSHANVYLTQDVNQKPQKSIHPFGHFHNLHIEVYSPLQWGEKVQRHVTLLHEIWNFSTVGRREAGFITLS